MMKKAMLSALLFTVCFRVAAQPAEYNTFIKQAQDLTEHKQYQQAAEAYSKAFIAYGNKGHAGDRYDAACAWALAGNSDSAFFQLNRLATKGNFTKYSHLTNDADLNSLHKDKRWDELCALVKQNKDKAEANLNKELVAILDTIYNDDQQERQLLGSIQKKHGANSPELKELWSTISRKDSINLIKVKKILDTYGWLGYDVIGSQGNQTLFLVIQHADIKTQQHYLPMMREAVKNKKASPSSLAMLEDRVALGEGRKQVYGSQIHTGKDGAMWVSPLEDPDNVDKRRAEVGLGPLAEYVKHWDMKWDVEAYKKQLPELEKKEKEQ